MNQVFKSKKTGKRIRVLSVVRSKTSWVFDDCLVKQIGENGKVAGLVKLLFADSIRRRYEKA